uniref:ATP synthase complex subunit 8 n=1 Tax=Nipponeurorthus fuscinervis TaxID=1821767 RepID=A0A1S5QY95_9NEOP|nr:ATP synthase F0 subunit 8 [Nipponeurorthus fuscinervis]
MPQMAPISWLTLFMYFSILMIIFSIMNFYIFSYNSPIVKNLKFKMNSLNWKW